MTERQDQMLCLRCKNEEFKECLAETPQVFRGENFTVKVPAMACSHCGWQTMTDEQADALSRAVADAYREKHQLLTSGEIKQARQQLGLSQEAFAKRVNVGVASVKRWETGFVQEKGNDDLIRFKVNQMMDEGVSAPNLLDWLTGPCAGNIVTLPGVGFRLLPKKEPPAPSWQIRGCAAESRTHLRKKATHDPALAPTA